MSIAPQSLPTARVVKNALRFHQGLGFVYLNNPKVGCSTVKRALWSGLQGAEAVPRGDDIHRVENSPFLNRIDDADQAAGAFVFTFVRNPYQRLVSAYLNKVASPKQTVWPGFARRFGLGEGRETSFDAFVEALAGIPAEFHDPHWRPQFLNTLQPFVKPNLVADLEQMDSLLPQVLDRVFPGRQVLPSRSGRRHSTGARKSWRDYLTDGATVRRIEEIYAADFDLFGYVPDPTAEAAPRRPVEWSDHRHDGLAGLIRFWDAKGADKAPALRALERSDASGTLRAWVLAQRLRLVQKNRERVASLLESEADLVARGPELLRRVARAVAAGAPIPDDDAEE